MIRKKTPSTNMKVYYGKKYSAWKDVAATIKSPATPDFLLGKFCKCASAVAKV